jgi:hypothetical protein
VKKSRRANEAFGIAFLDVITCGFGAIILLLVLAKPGDPAVLEFTPESLDGVIADLQQQLFEIRGKVRVMNRDLSGKREQISFWKDRVARLSQQLGGMENQEERISRAVSSNAASKDKLRLAQQNLTREMQRLTLQSNTVNNDLIGGIPVDSEYIIFVIDTSGSMFNFAWDRVVGELIGVLEAYPKVKGIQIMNDMGGYMFTNYRNAWIKDTPARRKIIIDRLRSFNPFSNSSPVEGINQAIRTFYDPNKKISIYVFGDDFTGNSIRQVLDVVDRLNPKDSDGIPQIRIHAIGFPVQFANSQQRETGIRFAALMRELSHRNMGTFVGLNSFRD